MLQSSCNHFEFWKTDCQKVFWGYSKPFVGSFCNPTWQNLLIIVFSQTEEAEFFKNIFQVFNYCFYRIALHLFIEAIGLPSS